MASTSFDSPARSKSATRMRRLLAPIALVAALGAGMTTGIASPAKAADCINGYRTLGNQVIVQCEAGAPGSPFGSTALYSPSAPTLVPPAVAARPGRSGSLMADGPQNCQPGMYWKYNLVEHGDVILAC